MKTTEQLDRDDTLGFLRQLYDLPNDKCYLDGNSFGGIESQREGGHGGGG